jgi:hypothetical protein
MDNNKPTKLTQCEKILRHFRDYGSINPLEALRHYGIMRLASRITDLKKRGYLIISEPKKSVNKYGEIVRFSVYRLADNGGNNNG